MARAFLLLLLISSTAIADPRNVLLIIADDQGLDLGSYGNRVLQTPNLDQLAARGTLFTEAFATVSSCSPSRSVIYTGLYSHSNGMLPFDEELAPERPGNRDVAVMADEARKFIVKSARHSFLLVVGYSDPHRAEQNVGNTHAWPQVKRVTYDPAAVIVPAHLPDLSERQRASIPGRQDDTLR